MPRYKLTIEYDGKGLVGWQKQNNGASVQEHLEDAVFNFTRSRSEIYGAGRTDAGVHATAQVAHVDIAVEFATDRVRDAMNAHLRGLGIVVLKAEKVDESFHARFSAVSRSYLYRITNRRPPLALDNGHSWWVPVALDHNAMHEAAQRLLGEHDFTSFRASECQAKSPVKTLDVLNVTRTGNEIRIICKARSFLHHQVRNFVGTLKQVGEGKWNADDVQRVLEYKDRKLAGPTAPAHGLYLTGVFYPAPGEENRYRTEELDDGEGGNAPDAGADEQSQRILWPTQDRRNEEPGDLSDL